MPIHITAFTVSFIISIICGPILIPILKRLKIGQVVRDSGPATHHIKKGIPTMGGIIFIIPLIICTILFGADFPELIPLSIVTIALGAIGFIDDFIKILFNRSLGLKARQKIFGIIFISAIFSFYIMNYTDAATMIYVPFSGILYDIGWGFIPFTVIVMLSTTNAVNLTDGLDGLAAGVTLIVILFFAMVAKMNPEYEYVMIFALTVAGGCLGFLIFNIHPARVFMGDIGSFALGGAVGAISTALKLPLILLIVGGIYVAEAVSVIIQVISFKISGKRVFKMAPLHHHFELAGWSESSVVISFWGITALLCLLGFSVVGIM